MICSCDSELHEYIDRDQITDELGGTVAYCHEQWLEQRVVSSEGNSLTELNHILVLFTIHNYLILFVYLDIHQKNRSKSLSYN